MEDDPPLAVVEAIGAAYEKCQKDNTRLTGEQLAELLHRTLQLFNGAYIAIDALDELPEIERDKLVQTLAGLPAKVVFTSRPLDSLHLLLPTASVINIEQENGKDIEAFIRTKIRSSTRLMGLMKSDGGALEVETVLKVQAKAQGM